MSITDIPVHPGMASDKVKEAYLSEKKAITTPEELRAFVIRWKPIFEVANPAERKGGEEDAERYRLTQKNQEALVSGEYDAAEALECLKLSPTEKGCSHLQHFSCPGAHIALPLFFMQAEAVSHHFGVPTDIAIIQIHGGMEAWGG